VVAGVNDRVEVWDEKAWTTYTKAIERDADVFAESLGTAI
jgi:DNA-binding transcriptional regulator/RsmH inhibitor MraZ